MNSGKRLDRRVGADREKQRRARQRRDRHEVLLRIVGELADEQRADRQQRGVDDEQRVAVRRRRRDHGGRDAAVAAGAVLHHHRLADAILQALRQQARGGVRHAARRVGHDELDGLARIRRLAVRRPRQAGRSSDAARPSQDSARDRVIGSSSEDFAGATRRPTRRRPARSPDRPAARWGNAPAAGGSRW